MKKTMLLATLLTTALCTTGMPLKTQASGPCAPSCRIIALPGNSCSGFDQEQLQDMLENYLSQSYPGLQFQWNNTPDCNTCAPNIICPPGGRLNCPPNDPYGCEPCTPCEPGGQQNCTPDAPQSCDTCTLCEPGGQQNCTPDAPQSCDTCAPCEPGGQQTCTPDDLQSCKPCAPCEPSCQQDCTPDAPQSCKPCAPCEPGGQQTCTPDAPQSCDTCVPCDQEKNDTDSPYAQQGEHAPAQEEPSSSETKPYAPDQLPNNEPTETTVPSAGQSAETPTIQTYEDQVVALVNVERAKAGLPALKMDKTLQAAALARAKETVRSFSHTRPNGSSCFTILGEYGIRYRFAGENIAYGQRSPEEVVTAWMNSEGHRANIMSPNFTTIGIGYYQAANGIKYWSQLFIS